MGVWVDARQRVMRNCSVGSGLMGVVAFERGFDAGDGFKEVVLGDVFGATYPKCYLNNGVFALVA